MRLIHHVLRVYLGKFFVVYFDDILIYSLFRKEHVHHLRSMLETLTKESLYANMEKYIFGMDHVIFLVFKINQHGVHVNQGKVMAINEWPKPKNVSELIDELLISSILLPFLCPS